MFDKQYRFKGIHAVRVDVLYEKLIEGASAPEDYANNIYDFIEEFQEKFNEDVLSEDILKLCSK